jgi:glycosyltransferase involved in cell wall biosynthesis
MRLGYLYSRYPVLSQTFCDAEMLELERREHEIILGSLYPPKTALRHEYLKKLRAPIRYAPSSRELDALARKAKRGGRWPSALVAQHEKKYGAQYKAALRARNALFFVELFEGARVPHFHVHFANRAAHTAMFVKAISGIPFSMTAHGQDFMSDLGNDELLRELCAGAEFVGAETDFSRDLLAARCPESRSKIFRVYNGIDLSRFPWRDVLLHVPGRAEARPSKIRFLSVGRLVAFKGFDILIDACAELQKQRINFDCEIIGDGALREELEESARRQDLRERIHFAGEQSQNYVRSALRDCDVFVLASAPDERGASDIFPTVIAEAMATGKPVVSTTVAGIPELVANGETGLLVPPGDARALANTMEQLARNENLRGDFGRAGRLRIEQKFTIEKTIEPLLERFEQITEGCPE